ncbi:MAG TPA: hypothetical protein VKP30_30655, partial [Polyangiaceae bacterium]|nr:hypothetical protein [Polyangiaceae bacterium]
MPSELEQLERDAAEMSAKREAVERRRAELMDQIAAAKQGKIASSAPSLGTGRIYRATSQVLNVL